MGAKTHEKQRLDLVALKRPEIHKVEDVGCTTAAAMPCSLLWPSRGGVPR